MKNVEVTPVLLVESTDAPASAVAEAITRYRDEVHADLIIAAKSNKVGFQLCYATCHFKRNAI